MSKYTPYSYQNQAINNVLNSEVGLNKKDRTQLIMSCGTGKSLTSMWIHEKYIGNLKSSLTILFYPSLFLVNQTHNTYKENSSLKFNPLVVCSDKAIGGENENDDVFELDASEVKYPVTTNVEDIKAYLNDISIKDKIVFVTYQSSQLIGQALNELGLEADLGIFDEAHKTATLNVDSKFAFALKDENVPISKRLFMTATPRHIKFNSEDDEEVEVFSMNNPELYGNIAYEYPMREAIDDKQITDYKIMGILIDDKYIDSYTNELKPFSEDVINEAKIKAVNEAMNKYKLNKALIFNTDIDTSKELEKYSNTSIFNKTIKHLDGTSKHSYREEVLKELKDSEQFVITNARLFTEGVDLPTIDMVALFRNVKSEIDIIQTVGRVQRKDKNNPKKVGYILLPIFVSNLENIDEEIKSNKDLLYTYEIINSLKENDEQLRATLEYKKQEKAKSKGKDTSKNEDDDSKIENPNFEIDYMVNDSNVSDEYVKNISEKITHRIEAVILDKRAENKTDEEKRDIFVQYNKEVGMENLKYNTKFNNENIGITSNIIKGKYNKSMPNEQQKMREFWDCFPDDFWKKKIKSDQEWKELFIQYDKEEGIENLRQSTKFNNENIGITSNIIKGKYNKSTPNEQQKMREFWDCFPESMWKRKVPEHKTDEQWKELFIQYGKEEGIENLRQSTKFNNENIGTTSNTIKRKYNKSTPEQQKEMREFWNCFPDDFWEKKIKSDQEWKELFIQYDKEEGIENLRQSTKFNNENIGTTSNIIKRKYNKSTPNEQQKMREFWDCFPESMWGKSKYKNTVPEMETIKTEPELDESHLNNILKKYDDSHLNNLVKQYEDSQSLNNDEIESEKTSKVKRAR